MKIAITADCHLKSDESNPERYDALRHILDQLIETDVNTLILAGDLFDKDANSYTRFEKIISQKKYSTISFIAIPGNHDINLRENDFTAKNFSVIEKPTWLGAEQFGIDFLFMPYIRNTKMAEAIEPYMDQVHLKEWVLVGHSNFIHGNPQTNPYEQGVYMPLFGADLQRYQPSRVFLGHIHKPYDSNQVIIPGSPCGLDITETGKRSYIIFNTTTMEYERKTITGTSIFLNEPLTMIPSGDETSYIQSELKKLFEKWDLRDDDRSFITLRLKVNGFSSNIRNAKKVIEDALNGIHLYNDEPIDFKDLKSARDVEKEFVIQHFKEYLEKEISEGNIDDSLRNEIELQGLNLVYGEMP